MKVVYVRAWSVKKPKTRNWYPVVFAKELVTQEKKMKRQYEARIKSIQSQVTILREQLEAIRSEKK